MAGIGGAVTRAGDCAVCGDAAAWDLFNGGVDGFGGHGVFYRGGLGFVKCGARKIKMCVNSCPFFGDMII